MKKQIFVLAFVFNILSLNAQQWTGSATTTGDIGRTGNVGIGTSTPDQPLTVTGNLSGNGFHLQSTSGAGVLIDRAGTANSGGVLWQTAGVTGWYLGSYQNSNLSLKQGNWAGTDIMTFQTSGNVGIGTSTPSSRLDVQGGAVTIQQGANIFYRANYLTMGNTQYNNFPYISFNAILTKSDIATSTNEFTPQFYNGGNAGGLIIKGEAGAPGLHFLQKKYNSDPGPHNYNTFTENLTLSPDGNLGIGATSPSAKLQVTGVQGTAFAKFTQSDIAATDAHLSFENGTILAGQYFPVIRGYSYTPGRPFGINIRGEADDIVPSAGDVHLGAIVLDGRNKTGAPLVNNNVLAVNNYGQNLLMIKSSGNVGIGTTNPNYNLHINSASTSSNLQLSSTATGNTTSDGFIIGTGITGRALITNRENTDMVFSTNNTDRMYLTAGGNLLLGKSTQSNSSYKLDVAGNVRADKITVNTTGADFVFDPSYKLMPLNDLHSYVQRNRHLPDISPASEMQSNGVDIGENQTKLLQKIEELTLYMIAQDKKQEEQEKVINRQNDLINEQSETLKQQQLILEELQKQINRLKQ